MATMDLSPLIGEMNFLAINNKNKTYFHLSHENKEKILFIKKMLMIMFSNFLVRMSK